MTVCLCACPPPTARSVWFSGLRELLFGLVAAALTYGVGHLIGVSLAG